MSQLSRWKVFSEQKAAPVPNVPQEKSRRLQAAVRAKLALPERTKSTSKFATRCPQGKVSAVPGSAACSRCDAGRFAKEALKCEECPQWKPFLQQDEVSVKAVLLGPFLTLEATPVPNAPQEQFRGFLAAPNAGNARQAHFLLQEVASVAIVLLESFLRQEAGTAQNALRERFSKDPGSIACEECPAGTHEVQQAILQLVPGGHHISCRQLGFAVHVMLAVFPKMALTCEPCPGGKFAGPNSSICQDL